MKTELDRKELEYFNHGFNEVKKFWKRFGGLPTLNATFLDVGCGRKHPIKYTL